MDERAAFERNIDENPLDWQNHLVYADWLDEHGEPDEAAFRRAMGEWQRTGKRTISPHKPESAREWQFQVAKRDLPDPLSKAAFFVENNGDEGQSTTAISHPDWRMSVGSVYVPKLGFVSAAGWRNYREFEDDFRRAFMAGRKKQLSRAAAAVSRFVRSKRGRK